MKKRIEQYSDFLARIYPEKNSNNDETRNLTRSVTFQVTDACNLACTYCYQINKGVRRMSFDTAKKMVDLILSGDKGFADYISPKFSTGLIIDFIGGEPFLEVDLIDQICDYVIERLMVLQHPWATKFMFSICSNGVLYTDPKVQRFLQKHGNHLSFSVTLDGDKELHDSCRVFHDGSPSYDLAKHACMDWMDRGNHMGSKITIAPGNLKHLSGAILHMVSLGYDEIFANTVFEKGWELEHATEFYYQLKSITDYFAEHQLFDKIYCSLFEEDMFYQNLEDEIENWCGGTGLMLSVDPDGWLYPCIRYMESSLGDQIEPIRIGHIDTGLGLECKHKSCIECLKKIDRRTQSTDECFYCPIGKGCAWCSGYNYQEFGTADERATYICDMHKARSLANAYHWNTYYKLHGIKKVFNIYCPEEWALEILLPAEWEMLKNLEAELLVSLA